MSEALFDFLIIGLEKYQRQPTPSYLYPVELIYAMNELALRLKDKYPKTFPAFLVMLEHPIGEWYPESELPPGLDAEATLLYKGRLDYIAEVYRDQNELHGISSLGGIQSNRDNQLMRELIMIARDRYARASDEEVKTLEDDYAQGRCFLIENSFVTWEKFRKELRFNSFQEEFGAMYEKAGEAPNLAKEGNDYWACRECGPLLMEKFDKPDKQISRKPRACLGRCPLSTGWHIQKNSSDLFVLKEGIHSRTMIPGRAEIELYKTLLKLLPNPVLKEVRLYPAIDRYDLQLRFEYPDRNGQILEEVWAVDVKDYDSPNQLGRKIKIKLDKGIHEAFPNFLNHLQWQRAFYVVPDYRDIAWTGYCNQLRVAIESHLFPQLEVLTTSEFVHLVNQFIWERI